MLHVFTVKDSTYSPAFFEGVYVPGRPPSEWHGGLRDWIELPPAPSKDSMSLLIERNIPTKWAAGGTGVRTAFNLTFSAPKGLSIAALLNEDERLLSAHECAVEAALTYIEANLSYRHTVDRVTRQVPAKGLLSAIFHRCVSRSGDPHLHSQVVLFNFCRRDDGTFCSLDGAMLFHAKHLFGLVYRSELTRLLAESKIPMSWKDDLCDVVGVDDNLKQLFSERRKHISDVLESDGVEDFKTSQRHIRAVAQFTAPSKHIHEHEFESLKADWTSRCEPNVALGPYVSPKFIEFPDFSGEFDDVMKKFSLLAQDRNGVARHKLVHELLVSNQGYLPVSDIEEDINALIDDGDLVEYGFPKALFLPAGFDAYLKSKNSNAKCKTANCRASATESARSKQARVSVTNAEKLKFDEVMRLKGVTISDLVRDSIRRCGEITRDQIEQRPIGQNRTISIGARITLEEMRLIKGRTKALGSSDSDILWAAICLDNSITIA